jgi:hypothetical protein
VIGRTAPRVRPAWLAAWLLWLPLASATAGSGDLGDVLEGFDDEPVPDAAAASQPEPTRADRPWRISGRVSLESAANLRQDRPEYEGLAKLRTELRLQLDAALPRGWKGRLGGRTWYDGAYRAQGRDAFGDAVLDAYEVEAEFWESWIAGPLGERVHLKLGREIVSFGTSETLRVVDAVFPLDNREPGSADLEELYLPELHARVDALLAGWQITGLAILERRFSELPPEGSSYLPPGPLPPRDDPGWSLTDPELLLSVRRRVGRVDVGLLGATFYADTPTLERDDSRPTGLRRVHDRLWMAGAVAAGAHGNWVFRGELAGFGGLTFAADPGREHRRLDALLGVDYSGPWGLDLAFDVVQRWLPSAPRAIEGPPDFADRHRTELALRAHRSFLRDRLRVTAVGIAFGLGLEQGGLVRVQTDYAWNDALTFTLGLLYYHSGDTPPTSALGRNDRVFAAVRYRF